MRFAHSHAVVIGIDAYTALPELQCAVDDAVAIGDVLEGQGYTVDRLVAPDDTTAAVLRGALEGLVDRLGPDDRLLIYFAGHGVAEDDDGGAPQGYLAPRDADDGIERLLSMAWLYDLVCDRIACRHRLLVLDCCFAGSFQWSATRMGRRRRRAVTLYRNRYRRFVESPAAQVLTSAAADQKALDVVGGLTIGQRAVVGGHSPFATALLDGLTGAADTDTGAGKDGVITATELYLHVRDAVEHHTRGRQTPGIWTIKGHVRGEFVFTPIGQPSLDALPEDPRLDAAANPWPGLVPYQRDQAGLFFGRAVEVEALQRRLDPADDRWLVAVVAASGTGKSSLVRAGLLPRLSPDHTVVGPIRPGEAPVEALDAVAAALDDARDAACAPLLVIDQFEEVFTLGCGEAEREAFIGRLVALGARSGVRVLITLRADFEAYVASTALGPALDAGRFVLGPMTRDGLREVIERPAEQRVLFFEPPDLVDRLVDEVVALPGGLPLLSFTLAEMYRAYVEGDATDRALTAAHYADLGGVIGALRTRAAELLAAADPAERRTIRRVMLRLVSGDAEHTRRRATMRELTYADPAEQRRVEAVVERFVAHRLLVRGAIEHADDPAEPFVEPAHDALVRGWSALYGWMAEARETLPLQQALWRAAHTWHQGGADPGLLWDADPRLPQAQSPAVKAELNALERRFVAASDRRRRRRRIGLFAAVGLAMALLAGVTIYALDEADRANEAEGIAQRRAIQSAANAREAKANAEEAEANAEEARQRLMLSSALRLEPTDPTRAALVAAEIDDLDSPAAQALVARLVNHPGVAEAALPIRGAPRASGSAGRVVIDPTERYVAASGSNLDVISLRDGRVVASVSGRQEVLAFDQAGRRLAYATSDDVRIIALPDGRLVDRLPGARVIAGAFDAAGRWFATIDADCAVAVWRAGADRPDRMGGPLPTKDSHVRGELPIEAAFSADGRTLVAGCLDAVKVWDLEGSRSGLEVPDPGGAARHVAASPDGTMVALGTGQGVYTAAVDRLDRMTLLGGSDGERASLAFDATGRLLETFADGRLRVLHEPRPNDLDSTVAHGAVRGRDGTVRLFSSDPSIVLPTIRAPGAGFTAVTLTADRRGLVGLTPDALRVWRLSPHGLGGRRFAPPDYVVDLRGAVVFGDRRMSDLSLDLRTRLPRSVRRADTPQLPGRSCRAHVMSADGGTIAARCTAPDLPTPQVVVWPAARPEAARVILDDAFPKAMAFGPGGSMLAIDDLQVLRLLDVADETRRHAFESSWDGFREVVFSSDGRRLLTQGLGSWSLFAVTDDALRLIVNRSGGIPRAVAFDRSSRFGVAIIDQTAEVVRTADGRTVSTFAPAAAPATFSPGGRWLVTSSPDHVVHLRRVADGAVEARFPGRSAVEDLRFGPRGERLLVVRRDGRARIWPVGVAGPPRLIDDESPIAAARFYPDGDRIVTVHADGLLRVRPDATVGLVASQRRLGERVRGCLSREDRIALLGEPERDAEARWGACLTRAAQRDAAPSADAAPLRPLRAPPRIFVAPGAMCPVGSAYASAAEARAIVGLGCTGLEPEPTRVARGASIDGHVCRLIRDDPRPLDRVLCVSAELVPRDQCTVGETVVDRASAEANLAPVVEAYGAIGETVELIDAHTPEASGEYVERFEIDTPEGVQMVEWRDGAAPTGWLVVLGSSPAGSAEEEDPGGPFGPPSLCRAMNLNGLDPEP